MSRLQRAREELARGYVGGKRGPAFDWAFTVTNVRRGRFLFEGTEVLPVCASLALDGYPASWPRPLRKKERRRP